MLSHRRVRGGDWNGCNCRFSPARPGDAAPDSRAAYQGHRSVDDHQPDRRGVFGSAHFFDGPRQVLPQPGVLIQDSLSAAGDRLSLYDPSQSRLFGSLARGEHAGGVRLTPAVGVGYIWRDLYCIRKLELRLRATHVAFARDLAPKHDALRISPRLGPRLPDHSIAAPGMHLSLRRDDRGDGPASAWLGDARRIGFGHRKPVA